MFIFLSVGISLLYNPWLSWAELTVKSVSGGRISTFLADVKLQGLSFSKRTINMSVPTFVSFLINDEIGINHDLKWFVNDVDVSSYVKRHDVKDPPPSDNLYTTETRSVSSVEITLHIQNKRLVPGKYTLSVSRSAKGAVPVSAHTFVTATPMLPLFSKVRKVLDGDRLKIFCEVTGYPLPAKVTWRFAHIKPELMDDSAALMEAQGNLKTLDEKSTAYAFHTGSVINDQLIFEKLPREFGGLYECAVGQKGDLETDTTLILVNIKDRWAALWPFIGIVIEVTVLVTGILLYERHQMRSRASKNEPPVVDQTGIAEISSPNTKIHSADVQQMNNVMAADDLNVDVIPDGNIPSGVEAGDDKLDDVRQRSTTQC